MPILHPNLINTVSDKTFLAENKTSDPDTFWGFRTIRFTDLPNLPQTMHHIIYIKPLALNLIAQPTPIFSQLVS